MTKYLVTGGSGFIGSALMDFLSDKNDGEVTGIGLGDKTPKGAQSSRHRIIQADVSDMKATKEIISDIKPDYIFHIAGIPASKDWDELLNANVRTAACVLEAAMEVKETRVFVVGSATEYGSLREEQLPAREGVAPKPETPYAASMVCRTMIAQSYSRMGLDVVIGRLFNSIGKPFREKSAPGAFAKQVVEIAKGTQKPLIKVGDLRPKRDFIDIEDVCEGFLAIAQYGKSGEIYNVCSGQSHSMKEMLELMIKVKGIDVTVETDQNLIRKNDAGNMYGSLEKVTLDTGWKPRVSFEESVRRMLS